MAKKIKSEAGGRPSEAKPRDARRKYLFALALLAAAAALGAGAWHWREGRRLERIVAAMPARPSLSGRPEQLARALDEASALVRGRSTLREGLAQLGRLYHANGYRAEAETCWRLLRGLEPGEPRWPYYLADLRRTASDYGEVEKLLEATLTLAPDYAPAWLQRAEQAFKTGNADLAERDYRRRLELVPGDPYARLGLARLALQAGRRPEARRTIEEIVRDVPDFPSSHNLLAEMLAAEGEEAGARRERELGRAAGRFREADDPWLSELSAWCYDPKRLFVLGTMEYQLGRGDRGLGYFRRALELAPEDPAGYEMLGDLYLKLGQPQAAAETLERCLQLPVAGRPPPVVFVLLSQSYRDSKDPGRALEAAERGLQRSGSAPELWNAKGAALADLQRHDDAIVAFREAIALNANDTEANFNLGASLLALGRTAEGVQAMRRSLVLQPRFAPALALLGQIEMEVGDLAAAESYLRRLLEANPTQPQARQLMAYWHFQSGQAAEKSGAVPRAEQHYRDGLALDAASPQLQASLGTLLLVQGRFADAIAPLEALRGERPEDPQAALFLGQAYAAVGRTAEAKRVLAAGAELAERQGNRTTAAHCREILQHL